MNFTQWLRTGLVSVLVPWLLGGGCLLGTSGCSELVDSHVKQMDLLRGMATDITARLNEGALAQLQASGQALNPGITAEAAVVYRASARFDGLAGQYAINASGTLGDDASLRDGLEAVDRRLEEDGTARLSLPPQTYSLQPPVSSLTATLPAERRGKPQPQGTGD